MVAGPGIVEGSFSAYGGVRSFAEVVFERLVVVVERGVDWSITAVVLFLSSYQNVLAEFGQTESQTWNSRLIAN